LSAAGAVPLPEAGRNVAQAPKLNSGLKGFPANFHMTGAKQGWGITLQGIWRTTDGAVSWKHPVSNTVPMPGEEFLISGIAEYFPDSSNGWIISAYGPQKPLFVFHTADQGQSWQAARLPVKADWEQGYSGGFIDFPERQSGYILLNSEPALGFMEKSFYRTTDGGKSWSRVSDITSSIEAYPTGMAFRDADTGWITSSNHGQEHILTFKTVDGGKTWTPEKLANPPALSGIAYSNSYPPIFSGKNRMEGLLPLEIVRNGAHSMVFYTSNNGGRSWRYGPGIDGVQASRTTWLNARTGWALQEGGKLLATVDGGVTWKRIARAELFDRAASIQFATSRNGWIAGPGTLWSTSDGGDSWTRLH
jgi:photosystem II stability/assembly factor-like uncharacterized protein